MAHLIARGTRSAPRWYVAYVDIDGGQKTRLLKGVATKADATRLMRVIEVRLQAVESRLADLIDMHARARAYTPGAARGEEAGLREVIDVETDDEPIAGVG